MLIYDILDKTKKDLTFLGKNMQNVEIMERSITEFKKHGITDERLIKIEKEVEDKYLKAKLQDMAHIYTKFQNNIKEKFLDENDTLTYLAENIKKSGTFKDTIICIDEFVRIYSARI